MEYYIPPEKPESDFLKITGPEGIKVCDPACGSGHMLSYAFDLLYAMYEEEGFDPAEIPERSSPTTSLASSWMNVQENWLHLR